MHRKKRCRIGLKKEYIIIVFDLYLCLYLYLDELSVEIFIYVFLIEKSHNIVSKKQKKETSFISTEKLNRNRHIVCI